MTKSSVRLSIGVPVYNQAGTIEETIESLLRQSVPAFEIVVCDNHSTDGTSQIIDRYAGRICIIRPPQHLKMMANWNFLVGELRGDWFSLLSGDDVALPNFVEVLVRAAARNTRAVLVRASFQLFDGAGARGEIRHLLSVRRHQSPPHTLYESLIGPKASFASFAVRYQAWQTVGGFPEGQEFTGDWGLWIRLAPLGDFIYEPKVISLYRANYRPGLEKKRLMSDLRDGVYAQTALIPEAASKMSGIDSRKIDRARSQFLRQRLAIASRLVASGERAEVVEILRPLAGTAVDHRLLLRFGAGATIRNRGAPPLLRNFFRHLLSSVFSLVHRHRDKRRET